MPINLQPNETAFYPQPFVESEPNLLVVTNQRIVQFGTEGRQEMLAREVMAVARMSERPLLIFGIIALFVGLPLIGAGVYFFLTAKGPLALPVPGQAPAAPQAAPASPADDPAAAASDDPAAPVASAVSSISDGTWQRLGGVAMVLGGFVLLGAGALMAARQRHLVLVRGGAKMMKLRAANKMEQMQLLSTLQAVQQAGKAQPAAAPAPAKAKLQVDDKGDPVKALQELAAQRAAGKVPEDEFIARREVLLERVKNRK